MNRLSISPIKKSNPSINTYKKTIKKWDEKGILTEALEDTSIANIYAIYFEDYFLAASSITLNPETMIANIRTVNGSNCHKELLDDYMSLELPKIAMDDFGAIHYQFDNTLKEEPSVLKKCL